MGPLCCGSERAAPDPALNTFPFLVCLRQGSSRNSIVQGGQACSLIYLLKSKISLK